MTQEEKQLLLKDLCARLPYGVKVHINSPIEEQNCMELFDVNLDSEHIGVGNEKWAFRAIPIIDDEDEAKVVKPYLRPMSSMTEEELKTFYKIEGIEHPAIWNIPQPNWHFSVEGIDWLLSKQFDFRGLIEKRLALEAPKDMYEY